jgi:preprotein translocase subunit SecY
MWLGEKITDTGIGNGISLLIRFLVAGRADNAGYFRAAASLDIPPSFTDLFQPIPAELFRQDISSTEIRLKNRE